MTARENGLTLAKQIWKLVGPLVRFPGKMHARVELLRKASRCRLGAQAVIYPSGRITNNRERDCIVIGKGSQVLGQLHTMGHGGEIFVGDNCFIGENTYIWSADSVRIGNRVLISHGVNIHDFIAHSLSAADRHRHFQTIFESGHPKTLDNVPSAPVTIEDDAWIGFGATILKGVTIGRGAVVGAQSVVTRDVDAYDIVVGNPARVIGRAKE